MEEKNSSLFKIGALESGCLDKILADTEKNYSPYACKSGRAIYKTPREYCAYRPPFIADVDNVLNHPLYNRYCDKTQVFSFYQNDDITRRALHVQLVSRIARTIGRALSLNLDLIEAIALGHDIGHTPFGHRGETYLDELYFKNAGKHFSHNVQSARALYLLNNAKVSLQTLDGVLCHNGEDVMGEYRPGNVKNFLDFDKTLELCTQSLVHVKTLHPSTMEGCVVRISDVIAYIGKDRQDLYKAGQRGQYDKIRDNILGKRNAEIIASLTANIIKNSMGKPYIAMDGEACAALNELKNDNYEFIYLCEKQVSQYQRVREMMAQLYQKLKLDLDDETSVISRFFVADKLQGGYYRAREAEGASVDKDTIAVDFLASMTDDYFVKLYEHYFGALGLEYFPYEY